MKPLGDGSLLVDDGASAEVVALPRLGDQAGYEIRFRDLNDLRIDVNVTWEANYVRENYGLNVPRPKGRVELRKKGEWWDYDPVETEAILDEAKTVIHPMVVGVDENIDYHFIVRHWIRGETFVCVSSYHPDRNFQRIAEALSRFTFRRIVRA